MTARIIKIRTLLIPFGQKGRKALMSITSASLHYYALVIN